MEDLIALTKQFIAIKGTANQKMALEQSIEFCRRLIPKNLSYVTIDVKSDGKKSLVVTHKGIKNPTIFLHGHVDIVPAPNHCFILKQKGGKLYGRGAYDMKITLLTYLSLISELSPKLRPHIGLMIVSDEEVGGHNGAKVISSVGYKPKFFITGEPTDMDIHTTAKGVLWLEITQKGKSAHSSVPWEGKNAIAEINKSLSKLLSLKPIPRRQVWETTYGVGKIVGGNVLNSIPDQCKLYLDIRYVPEESPNDIVSFIQELFPKAKIKIMMSEKPIQNDGSNIYIQKLEAALYDVTGKKNQFNKNEGSNDARFYSALGIPAISFSPVGDGAHSEKEWIDMKSLSEYKEVLKRFVLSIT